MAGYSGFSKSNNALQAEREGIFPASVLARRLGVKPGAIRALLVPCEFHHTSKHFNRTDYYSQPETEEALDELRTWKESAKEVQVFENCSGVFLEWSGTRNFPRATEIAFNGARVIKKGEWFTIELSTRTLRKNGHTRGFQLLDAAGRRLVFNP